MNDRHVLIVQAQSDEGSVIASAVGALDGFHVDTCLDEAAALDLYAAVNHDLVIVDPLARDGDGIRLIQRLAMSESRPVLALLGSNAQSMRASVRMMAESLGLTVLPVLSEPVSVDQLRSVLARADAEREASLSAAADADLPFKATRECLRNAIACGEITAWFQPKKSLDSGFVVAAEALVRWIHPEFGPVPPACFLPLVEEHALEPALLRHVLQASIEAQHQWRRLGSHIPVSINLPTHLLERSSLPDELLSLTMAHGGVPSDLSFELLESSTTRRESDYHAGACRLRLNGFGLAQDDFGQGLSSMHKLASTPFTEVKIDRSLVQGCSNSTALQSVLDSVITLGRKLGMRVVAEGVETDDELATLRTLGCTQAQGFLISAALPKELFGALLGKKKPRAGRPAAILADLAAVTG